MVPFFPGFLRKGASFNQESVIDSPCTFGVLGGDHFYAVVVELSSTSATTVHQCSSANENC